MHNRRHAFALPEQCLYVRAAMKRVHAHHDVEHCSRVVAMHGLVRAAVKSTLAVNRSTATVVTRHRPPSAAAARHFRPQNGERRRRRARKRRGSRLRHSQPGQTSRTARAWARRALFPARGSPGWNRSRAGRRPTHLGLGVRAQADGSERRARGLAAPEHARAHHARPRRPPERPSGAYSGGFGRV